MIRSRSTAALLLYERVGSTYRIITLANTGDWRAVDRQELIRTGYPRPGGRLYLVAALDTVANPPSWLADVSINTVRPAGVARAAPFAVSWLDLMLSVRTS
jgi:hypothetical protein